MGVDQCSPAINLLLAKRGDPKRGAEVSPALVTKTSAPKLDDSNHGANAMKTETKDQQQNKTTNNSNSQDGSSKDMEAFPVASSIEYLETVKVN